MHLTDKEGKPQPTLFDPSYGRAWSGTDTAAAEWAWEVGSVEAIRIRGGSGDFNPPYLVYDYSKLTKADRHFDFNFSP